MLVLGILLIVLALIVFGFMYFGTMDLPSMEIDLGIITVQLTPLGLYIAGAVTLIVLAVGLQLLFLGLRAQRRRHKEVKELRKAVAHETPESHDRARAPEAPAYEREVRPAAVSSREPGGSSATEGTGAAAGQSRPGTTPSSSSDYPPAPGPTRDEQIALPSDHLRDNPREDGRRHS